MQQHPGLSQTQDHAIHLSRLRPCVGQMTRYLDIPVNVADEDRVILVTDYTFHRGRKAILFRAPEDCSPAEPAEVDDIECKWQDTDKPLTDAEFQEYQERIEESIFERMLEEFDEPDVDRDPL